MESPSQPSVDAIGDIVRASESAAMAVELPSGTILAANQELADSLGVDIESLPGVDAVDLLASEYRVPATSALQMLADGWLAGYQAVREFRSAKAPGTKFELWFTAMQFEGRRIGIASLVRLGSAPSDPQMATSRGPAPAGVVLGSVDTNWRITRLSRDIVDLLGMRAEECIGEAFLGLVHPADAPRLLTAIEQARQCQRTIKVGVRLHHRSGDWTDTLLFVDTTSESIPPAFGFAIFAAAVDEPSGDGDDRTAQLEMHLLRIANEISAAGVMNRLMVLPDCVGIPGLSRLTSKEWETLALLAEGRRVSDIAAHLFVSQSTVRNHLSAIYAKMGVHSQAELLRLLRSCVDGTE